MKEAIQKAIEGGFPETFTNFGVIPYDESKQQEAYILTEISRKAWLYPRLYIDPKFWMCLLKAMGAENETIQEPRFRYTHHAIEIRWHYEMHQFLDHVAVGKDPEEFFTNLLK